MRLLKLALVTPLLGAAKPVIGGQAVIEGVMMRSPKSFAVAVRKPDGSIAVREERWLSFTSRLPFLKWPLLRGATMLVESLYNGLLALNFSAAAASETVEDTLPIADHGHAPKKESDGLWLALLVSMAFAFGLFKGVPHLSAWGLGQLFAEGGESALPMTSPLFHIVDGAIKLALFIGYLLLISRMEDVKRLFMYHGAEHKSVHAYEANLPLDVEHAAPFTTAHPRCGTSLMLIVLATSMLVFAAVLPFVPQVFEHSFANALFLLVIKMPLLLPIAGIGYELQRAAAKNPNNLVVRALIAPGMLLQRLTTREPGAPELEVALAALQKALWRERQPVGEVLALPRETTVEVFPDFAAVAKKVA
jgi:uncharacterized protein YqhQ